MSYLEKDTRKPLPDTSGFFDVSDSRLAVYAKEGDSYGVAALVSPLAQPPQAWTPLGLPPMDWTSQSSLLEEKKSVVVIFSGYGTAEYLQGQATASPTPTAPGEGPAQTPAAEGTQTPVASPTASADSTP